MGTITLKSADFCQQTVVWKNKVCSTITSIRWCLKKSSKQLVFLSLNIGGCFAFSSLETQLCLSFQTIIFKVRYNNICVKSPAVCLKLIESELPRHIRQKAIITFGMGKHSSIPKIHQLFRYVNSELMIIETESYRSYRGSFKITIHLQEP